MTTRYIDLTSFANGSRTTGIQRVMQDLISSGWSTELSGVYFSAKRGGFIELGEPSVLNQKPKRRERRAVGRFFWQVSEWIWGSSAQFRQRFGGGEWVIHVARQLYEITQGRRIAAEGARLRTGTVVHPGHLLLMDVPTDSEHLDHLHRVIDSGSRLSVYLYDVMPSKSNETWSHELHSRQKKQFSKFLGLVMRAQQVVCMSEFTAAEYRALCASEGRVIEQKVSVAYPPVNLDPITRKVDLLRANTGSAQHSDWRNLRIMAVAPLLRRKNLRVVFWAIERLVHSPDLLVSFRLICPHSASVDIEAWKSLRRLQKNPRVDVIVRRDISDEQLVEDYAASQCVVVPSLYEGFGLPVVEGAAAGNCVIASDIPVFREIAAELNLRLVDPHTCSEWELALLDSIGQSCSPQRIDTLLATPAGFLEQFGVFRRG